jgi:hypothetical protein
LAGASYHGPAINSCTAAAKRVASRVADQLTAASALLAIVLLAGLTACSASQDKRPAVGKDGGDSIAGSVEGRPDDEPATAGVQVTVEWHQPPAELVRSPGYNRCKRPNRAALSVHTMGGVRNAAVWLEVTDDSRLSEPSVVSIRDCAVFPRVVVVPPGTKLEVHQLDETPHLLKLEQLGDSAAPAVELPLQLIGQRYDVEVNGQVAMRGKGTDPGYAVAGSTLSAVTSDRGIAEISNVPPGKHVLVVWHPPIDGSGKPLRITQSVEVVAEQVAKISVGLAPEK